MTKKNNILSPNKYPINKLTLIIYIAKGNNILNPIQRAQTNNKLTIGSSPNKQYAIDIIQISQLNHQMQYDHKPKLTNFKLIRQQ